MSTEPTERYPAAPPRPGHRAIMLALICVSIAASVLAFSAAMFMGAGSSVAPLFRFPVIYLTVPALVLVVVAVVSVIVGGGQVYRATPPAPARAATPPPPPVDEPVDPWAGAAPDPVRYEPATYGAPATAAVSPGP